MGKALASALLVATVSLLRPSATYGADDVRAGAPEDVPIFRVIVTRHGVRSVTQRPSSYDWPSWDPVDLGELTNHGYRLIMLMGKFYRDDKEGVPVDCKPSSVFIYAAKDQRTLETALALREGLCGSPDTLAVFLKADNPNDPKDPIFDSTEFNRKKIRSLESEAAVKRAAGDLLDFNKLQQLLSTRCSLGPCAQISLPRNSIECASPKAVDKDDEARAGNEEDGCKAEGQTLAALEGPVATTSGYGEDLFLEYAQCMPEQKMTKLDAASLRADLDAGMRLHVLAYRVNARNALDPDVDRSNAYNPLVRGSTLLAHIVAMLDRKAGRPDLDNVIKSPPEVTKNTTLVIFSGHDTQLAALGGVLGAHWTPGGGIVADDMPPGSALIFDLLSSPDGKFMVRLRFAAMRIDQFRKNARIDATSIATTPVSFDGCAPSAGCSTASASLDWFNSLAQELLQRKPSFVYAGWPPSGSPPKRQPLKDPVWTPEECRR